MRRPFTIIAALLIGFIAAAQATRAFLGVDVVVDTFHVPIVASWVAAGVGAFISLMLFREASS
jgi:hypothetical protein